MCHKIKINLTKIIFHQFLGILFSSCSITLKIIALVKVIAKPIPHYLGLRLPRRNVQAL